MDNRHGVPFVGRLSSLSECPLSEVLQYCFA